MKLIFLAVVVALCAYAAAEVEHFSAEDWEKSLEDDTQDPETYGLILNSSAKKGLKNFLTQLQCGFPSYGVPPLAPYTNAHWEYQVAKSAIQAMVEIIRFRFDGLDDLDIKTLKISYTFNKKVKFHFVFKELKATAYKMNSQALIDFMEQLGISVEYAGSGPLELALHDLSFKGEFKYKMPFFWGSIKIYKFQMAVHLGGVSSKIGGIGGNGRINEFINRGIENTVENLVNGNEEEISDWLEETIVPLVNEQMQGKKVWSLLGQLTNSSPQCHPTPAPWLAYGEV